MYDVTPETIRVELARHMILKSQLARHIHMDGSVLSAYTTGARPLSEWAAHNIGLGINQLTGLMVFKVNMALPLQKGKSGWPKGKARPELPAVRKRRRKLRSKRRAS